MRRAVRIVAGAAVTLTTAALLGLPGAEASGNSTVVVRGATIPDGSRSQLDLVGCDSVFGGAPEPITPMIGLGPEGGPAGKRSLAFDLAGGNAVGSLSYVDQVAATTVAGMSVHAQDGTAGVAYVGYQAPADRGTSRMWIGRAALTVPAGAWTTVDVTGLGFAWTQYDLGTRQPIGGEVGSSGIPAFVQAMGGDGYGFYLVGFGCDGHEFNTDAWRIGTGDAATTYDFEGYGTRTTIAGPTDPVDAGQRVTLDGRVVDDLGSPASGARVVLQSLEPDGNPRNENDWATVRVATGARVTASLRVDETTTYRWKVFTTPSTDGSASDPLTVTVADPDEQTTPEPSDQPSDRPTDRPSDRPSDPPADRPTDGATSAPAKQAPAEQRTPKAPASTTPATTSPAGPTAAATPTPTQSSEPTPEPTPQQTPQPPSQSEQATAPETQDTPAG